MPGHEVIAFREGELHLWTGDAQASGSPVAWVRGFEYTPSILWRPLINGRYREQERRIDFSFNMQLAYDTRIQYMFNEATAVHAKFTSRVPGHSAGVAIYSGYLQNAGVNGGITGMLGMALGGFAHDWEDF